MARVHFRRIDASLALLLAVAAPACGDSGGESASASAGSATNATGVTSASSNVTAATEPTPTTSGSGADSEGVSGSSGSGGATGTGSSTSGDLKLDVGINESTGGTGEPSEGCRKVDFLFVIDNSGSMSEEQDNLIASFPSFIQTIQQELKDAQDYHIMVVDSDAYVFADCETICPLFFNLCPGALDDYQCGITKPEECEDVLGAGVVHPKGQSSSGKNCNFQSQGRYMDISEPDLTASFSCAAKVGTGSTDDPERPMQAMVAAVAPKGESTDCNLGFLRSDAILVVTFITDEDDDAGDGSNGTVEGWKASLIAAKKGDASALVVLGLFGDGDQVNPVCTKDAAEPSPRLRAFVDSFGDHGVAGSVCSPSYQTFFQEAVAIIDTTCDGFVPPPM